MSRTATRPFQERPVTTPSSATAWLTGMLLISTAATALSLDRPKRYRVATLPDGRLEITVTGKMAFPDGGQVRKIDLREKLDAAAARECPRGYDMETEGAARLGVAPGGQGLMASLKGVIRCKTDAEEHRTP